MTNACGCKQLDFGSLDIEGIPFAATATTLGSTTELILGGAGFRGLEIQGKLIKFTAIGIYVEAAIIPHLSQKLAGKSLEELCENDLIFNEVVAAPHDKLVRVTFLAPLTGPQYSEKVVERIGLIENSGVKEESLKLFLEIFKTENFPPGTSVVVSFTKSALKIAFTKDNEIPKEPAAVIEDEAFACGFLASIIGKDGVSPAAKNSFAKRIYNHLK
ncbi:hypothetical protein KP509_33G035400 [Ceratopteris richardii]|nr:hypothetical protein KP509_33G035400 [Ceratopteris richardii]KAH7285586.1 hypothetical protein KP509_33G035400 [Ceratopteris richardii]